MVKIPFELLPSISNIVRGEDTAPLFDGDVNTVYNPTTPSWQAMLNPVTTDILIDTKFSSCIIRELRFIALSGGSAGTKVYFITKTKEKKLAFTFPGYQDEMKPVPLSADLQVELAGVQLEAGGGGPAYPNNLEFWGDYTEKQIVLKPRTPQAPVNLFGFVCYLWNIAFDKWPSSVDTFNQLKPSGIRVYDDWTDGHDNSGNLNFDKWNQFTNYATLKGMGVNVKQCIQNDPWYPYALGPSRLDPATYLNYASGLQKYAIANKAKGSPVRRVQGGNEQDKSWGTVAEYMDGFALAALCSACFDGHKGKLPDAGIKQIDPAVKFVNPGCATDRTQILHQFRLWSVENRGYRANGSVDFPFDVYEFHWYQSLGGQYAGKPGGMPPEIVINRVQEIVDFFREYCPEMEINIGEYGLDFHPESDLNAPAYGKYDAQQTRGNWFVRDIMMFAKLGIDAAEWYRECMDWTDDPADPGGSTNLQEQNGMFFQTMDLIVPSHYAQPATYKRRIAGDYFRQLGDVLRQGYTFDSVVSTSPYVFKFKKDGANLYAAWTLETITWPAQASLRSAGKDPGAEIVERWKQGMNAKHSKGGKRKLTATAPLKAIPRATITENETPYMFNVKGELKRFVDGADAMSSEPFNGGSITLNSKPVFIIESGSTPPTPPPPDPNAWTYTGKKGYWIVSGKRLYYALYKLSAGTYQIKTGDYTWYKAL
jgi:hypothetical protein